MKKLLLQKKVYKPGNKLLVLLLCFIFSLLITKSYAQSLSISYADNWNGIACVGDVTGFEINNPVPNVSYTWVISPSGLTTINYITPYRIGVEWRTFITGAYQIYVYGSDGSSAHTAAWIAEPLDPYITTSSEVKCQEAKRDDRSSYFIVNDENGCMDVCEHSTITYHANSLFPLSINQYSFEWAVVGGTFQPSGGTTLTSTFANPIPDVTVEWGAQGSGSISVTEIAMLACAPKTKTVCIEKIENPHALFTFDLEHDDPPPCYEICANHTVYFHDLSTASANSQILYWEWDFGDGSPVSPLVNPYQLYDIPGEYYVVLTVTNECGCTSRWKRKICVSDKKSPDIYCPSVLCENEKGIYGTNANCDPYNWGIIGGTQQTLPALPHNEIAVLWNNVGPDGYGYLTLDGATCEGKCPSKTIARIPVIQNTGTITGPLVICGNNTYRYKLPDWPATDFTWQIDDYDSTGTQITSWSENGYEIEIHTSNNEGMFRIICSYENTIAHCPGTAVMEVAVRSQPEIIAPERSCVGDAVHCDLLNPPSGSGNTMWTLIRPNGMTTQFGPGQNIIIPGINNFNIPGIYTIEASNPNVFCDPEPVIVNVVDPPPDPVGIHGEDKVCLNYPYAYDVGVMPNTIINWTISGGHVSGSTSTTATGNIVNVIWTTFPATLSASRSWDDLPGCTSGVINKQINQIVISGHIDGITTVCADGTANYQFLPDPGSIGVSVDAYEWSIIPAGSGSILPDNLDPTNPAKISVTFNHTLAVVNCTIRCKVIKCGNIYQNDLQVNIQPSTIISSLTPSTTICSGDVVTFTVTTNNSTAHASSFNWDFGNGQTATTNYDPLHPNTSSYTEQFINFGNSNQIFTVSIQAVSSCNMLVSAAATVNITVKPQPIANITPGGTIKVDPPFYLIETISGNGSYFQWYFRETGTSTDKPINGATSAIYNITDSPVTDVTPSAGSSFGQYWAVVWDANHECPTITNIVTVLQKNCPNACIPLGPAGFNNFIATLTGCGTVSASCTTLGTPGVNIIGNPVWSFIPYGVPYTETGTGTFSNSPVYTVTQPGNYAIKIEVTYLNSDPNGPPCTVSEYTNVVVPLIADITWGMSCPGNNGYVLTLTDNSSVFGINPVTSRVWKINGIIVGSGSASFSQSMAAYLGTTISVELTVDNGSAYTCTISKQIIIPNLPVADFGITTTNINYLHLPQAKSCEGRDVIFTNLSLPDPHSTPSDIISNVWDFGDQTTLHSIDASKVYVYNSSNPQPQITLTITDKYGCWDDQSYNVTINPNNLSADPNVNYHLNPATPPCYTPGQIVRVTVNSSGSSPNAWQWYSEDNPLTTTPSSVNYYDAITQGPYWVQLIDNNYCFKNINPTPAIVSFQFPVEAVITGEHDSCESENYSLSGPAGTGLNYSWTVTYNLVTQSLNPPPPGRFITEYRSSGIYSYLLTVSGPNGCISISAPFVVNVHQLPASPTITPNVIDCPSYRIELTASSGVSNNFNWSTGQTGSSIQVTHGGPYRVWITDQYGCKGSQNIQIPLAPSTYFWRFPIGCYTYCPEDLLWPYIYVNGPSHVNFAHWAWNITNHGNTQVVYPNHGYPGEGFGSSCGPGLGPLYIDKLPDGSGSGDYTWSLDNGLCSQVSEVMSVTIKDECCNVEITKVDIKCDPLTLDYIVKIDLINTMPQGCTYSLYNLSIFNQITGTSIYSYLSSGSPTYLGSGFNQIEAIIPGTIDLIGSNTPVTIHIETFCNNFEHCSGDFSAVIPPCESGKSMSQTGIVNEIRNVSTLNIIPNPANTVVDISYYFADDNTASNRTIEVYDVVGKPIAEINIGNAAGTYKLDVSRYAQGIYFVEMRENSNHVISKRIIINH